MEISINYWAVLVSALAYMAIGSVWYGPLFGKKWMKLSGLTKESMKSMPLTAAQAMAGGLVTALITAFVLAHDSFVWMTFDAGYTAMALFAFQLGFWIWLGYVVTTQSSSWLWEGKPFKLLVLNAAHSLIVLQVMAFILVYWQ